MKIVTKQGTSFPIEWAGICTSDKSLRFEIRAESHADMRTLFYIFNDTEHTKELKVVDDDRICTLPDQTFENYTFFKGMDWEPTGNVVIRLLQG